MGLKTKVGTAVMFIGIHLMQLGIAAAFFVKLCFGSFFLAGCRYFFHPAIQGGLTKCEHGFH